MCTPCPVSEFRNAGSVATSVFPSPVFISAIFPSCRTIPPISCTSKCRIPSVRRPTSRVSANAGANRRLECLLQFSLVVGIVALDAFKALLHFGPQRRCALGDLRVGELLHLGFKLVDRDDRRRDPLDVALVLRPDKFRDYAVYNLLNVHVCFLPPSLFREVIPLQLDASLFCIVSARPRSRKAARRTSCLAVAFVAASIRASA